MKALLVGATRHLAARPLRENGYDVANAWTEAEAVSFAETFAPDVVLVGDAIARASPELCARLRTARSSALVVIAETTPTAESEPVPELGAHAYLRQPLGDDELISAIRVLLQGRISVSSAQGRGHSRAALTAAAHRIRNPLASLVVASSMLRTDEELGEHAHRLAETIARNVEEVTRSIEALLDTSQLIDDSTALALSTADLRDVVRSAVASLDAGATARVSLSLPSDPMIVLADPEKLGIAVRRLVGTARAHAPDAVAVEMSRNGANAKVTVHAADGGATSPWEGDAEIGLSLARRVIGHHGGEVGLRGPTMWFELKLQQDATNRDES